MEWISDPDIWIAFLTLCALEIVLGIDNIIFISIVTNRLPEAQQSSARRIGLLLAMLMRIVLLFSLTQIMALTGTLFTVFNHDISGRDLILLIGGMFLLYKSVSEIHSKVAETEKSKTKKPAARFGPTIVQIVLIDLIFSFDSVITAVGMVDRIEVMIAAVIFSVGVMMFAAGPISRFINRHPAVKVLALSFLMMIGLALIAEGVDFHIPKGFIYFAMAFSIMVELINIRIKAREE